MKPLMSNDPETKSADILAENIEQIKAIFPEALTEGKIDFSVLKQLLGSSLDEREEKYGLNWHGKRLARKLALTLSTGTLRPCPEESVDWDTTQNLMIEGDNLEVLKLLQKSYAGKVKLIYIDPPYNIGGDFVYPDDFQDSIKNYRGPLCHTTGEQRSGQGIRQASRLVQGADAAGHVQPRLGGSGGDGWNRASLLRCRNEKQPVSRRPARPGKCKNNVRRSSLQGVGTRRQPRQIRKGVHIGGCADILMRMDLLP
jgi:hypothetical protein